MTCIATDSSTATDAVDSISHAVSHHSICHHQSVAMHVESISQAVSHVVQTVSHAAQSVTSHSQSRMHAVSQHSICHHQSSHAVSRRANSQSRRTTIQSRRTVSHACTRSVSIQSVTISLSQCMSPLGLYRIRRLLSATRRLFPIVEKDI
jgi:hypothetical protein